jgi:hypothetical protein
VSGLCDLTASAIRKPATPGLCADGGNLNLRVGSASQKLWVFLFQRAGKQKEKRLGSVQKSQFS